MYETGLATGSQPCLRRNVHRLEKGLIMKNFRKTFGVGYVRETVEELAKAIKDPCRSPEEVGWAADVLRQYFYVAGGHQEIKRAREAFGRLEPELPADSRMVPYAREDSVDKFLGFDELLALARRRRSVRWFLPEPVPRESLERAMLVAREAPSACNRQPFVFRVFDNAERVRRVARLPMGTKGYADYIPCVVVAVGRLRNFPEVRDRHLIYIDASLAGMSLALALETLGLSSCMINWPDIEKRERWMEEELGLAPDERPVFLMAVGYPDPEGLVARSTKKPVDELLVFQDEREGSK
jgi:nitroreductase